MKNSKLESRITDLKRKLLLLEGFDKNFSLSNNPLSVKELKELRERVLYIHFVLEVLLEHLIASKVCRWGNRKIDRVEIALDFKRLGQVFSKMQFNNKLIAATDLDLVPNKKLVWKVNEYRNWFSHPAKFKREIKSLEDRNKYLEALEILENSYFSTLEHYLSKVGSKWK
jgi:hypothetical protein